MGDLVRLRKEKGAALLTVLVALMLISLMTLELQYTSLIERKLAYNDLNHIQAHYLAKSGAKLALLRIVGYGRALNDSRYSGLTNLLSQIWSMPFPAFPPDQASLSKLSIQDKTEQEESLKETRISTGQFTYSINSQSTKLNLNLLRDDGSGTRLDCLAPLTSLSRPTIRNVICHNLYAKIDQLLKASDDPQTEYGNIKIQEVIDNIIDWISPTDVSFGASNKDAWYEQQVPPYKAKRCPFFTLDELKLVKDVSPTLFLKLQPIVTVSSEDGRIDIDQATQNRTLRTYFPDLNPEAEKRIYNDFALRKGTWGGVPNFFQILQSYDSYSSQRYDDNLQKQAFTIGSYNFIIRSQGIIKKSGSEIQRNMVLQVALDSSAGCSVKNGVSDLQTCSTQKGFMFADGKCYSEPTTYEECSKCGLMVHQNPGSGCQVRGEFVGKTNPYPLPLAPSATATSAPTKPTSAKIYSWVES